MYFASLSESEFLDLVEKVERRLDRLSNGSQ